MLNLVTYALLIPVSLAAFLLIATYLVRSANTRWANLGLFVLLPFLITILGLFLVFSPFPYIDFVGGFLLVFGAQLLVALLDSKATNDGWRQELPESRNTLRADRDGIFKSLSEAYRRKET